MQCLFEGSDETPGVQGLGIIPGAVGRFPAGDLSVPHIGWNGVRWPAGRQGTTNTPLASSHLSVEFKVYFVHSFRVAPTEQTAGWELMLTDYGTPFVAAVGKGNVLATQFHPEKSGPVGLDVIKAFLTHASAVVAGGPVPAGTGSSGAVSCTTLARRVVACLDVRSNDKGDLVVTKGDQYDVREKSGSGDVRNLGKPVDLAARYYSEGADEVAFLNITAFRGMPLEDQPMLQVLEEASKQVFVPLTIGGGIRAYRDDSGKVMSALDVASRYFRAGADKVSIGSDAVYAAEEFYANNQKAQGNTAIEEIAEVYGSQAVVISVDPRRVYVPAPQSAPGKHLLRLPGNETGPEGQPYVWYQCTVKGGREGRDLDAVALAKACEALGAGELLVNCVDSDGQKAGFDQLLMQSICEAVSIPVIASSGAGTPQHFVEIFKATRVEAALAAGIFHRREVGIDEVKAGLMQGGVPCRTLAVASSAVPTALIQAVNSEAKPASAKPSTWGFASAVGIVALSVGVAALLWHRQQRASQSSAQRK